jgi:hypothetical protein
LTFSIDVEFVQSLRRALPLETFVETGTFEGEAVERMLPIFDEIYTIELSSHYYERAVEQFQPYQSVSVYHGDSPRVLKSLQTRLESKAVLYWLDAHWCDAPDTNAAHDGCPLLDELEALSPLNHTSVVLIDDARLFLAPPPQPHDISEWPRFAEILAKLSALSSIHETMVINDVIVLYPSSIVDAVVTYAHDHGFDWLAAIHTLGELEKDRESLSNVAAERLAALEAKEREIEALALAAQERLETIERLTPGEGGSLPEQRKLRP